MPQELQKPNKSYGWVAGNKYYVLLEQEYSTKSTKGVECED